MANRFGAGIFVLIRRQWINKLTIALTDSSFKWQGNTFWFYPIFMFSGFTHTHTHTHTHLFNGKFKDLSVTSLKLKRDQNKALLRWGQRLLAITTLLFLENENQQALQNLLNEQKSKGRQFLLFIFCSVTHVFIPTLSRLDFYLSRITRTCTKPVFMPLSIKYIRHLKMSSKIQKWQKRLTMIKIVQINRLVVSAPMETHCLPANTLSRREYFKP